MSSVSAPSASSARPSPPRSEAPPAPVLGRRRAGRLGDTRRLRAELARAIPERPFTVVLWDGTRVEATRPGGPTFFARSPDAVAHVLRAPGQLGLGRAYVAGDLDPDDLDAALELIDTWSPPPISSAARRRLVLAALRAHGLRPPPRVPAAELRLRGERHSRARDARAVRHHYDVSNEYFALFLDASMTYSCGIFSRGAETLEEAQETKLELVCTKLGLRPGDRVLDVGCGWGSFAVHAAERYGVHVTGITLSEPQAAGARERAKQAGVSDRVDIRVMDYRELAGERFDAIASIGMVEHVGAAMIDDYAATLARLLEPGGRLLNHGITRLRFGEPEAGPFSERYVFPDAAPLHLSRVQAAFEKTGFETLHVEGFRMDYARTLREWLRRLDANHEEGLRLAGPERMRVWAVYLRAARRGFETGFTSVYQVLADRAQDPASRNEVTTIGSASVSRQPGSPSSSATSSRQPA
jgi:cyclopropane-fatty-acyl-phospholipid synthase